MQKYLFGRLLKKMQKDNNIENKSGARGGLKGG